MQKFEVEVKEILTRKIYVMAETEDEAKEDVSSRYASEEIVLDWSDIDETILTVKKVDEEETKESFPKSGIYEVYGNTVEYQQGEIEGYDVDSASYIPVELIRNVGEFIDSF